MATPSAVGEAVAFPAPAGASVCVPEGERTVVIRVSEATSTATRSTPCPGATSLRSGWQGSRAALLTWTASRVAVMGLVVATAWTMGVPGERHPLADGSWFLDRFAFWDSYHFVRIAEQGYLPKGLPCCDQAFFPGYPLLMAALRPLTGGSTIGAGILVSALAGLAGAAMLWRLARDIFGSRDVADTAVRLMAVAPAGVFFSAVYTETTFLALAVGAWWAGGRRRWWLAGALATAATGVRVNGLFLAAGLAVMYAVQLGGARHRRPRLDVAALLLPLVVVAGFVVFLHSKTGSWNAWRAAEATGWARERAWPWQGLQTGWRLVHAAPSHHLQVTRAADLVAVVFGLLLVVALLVLRRWAEATYVGLSVGVVVCSTVLTSAPRYALTWFPAYLLLAELGARPQWRWLTGALTFLALPLLALSTVLFALRMWVA